MDKKFEEIRKRVHKTSLHISMLREEDKTRFLQIAEQFKNDYGITLRYLLDCTEGFFTKPDEELNAKIEILADEVNKVNMRLDSLSEKPKEEKEIRSISGKKIGKR